MSVSYCQAVLVSDLYQRQIVPTIRGQQSRSALYHLIKQKRKIQMAVKLQDLKASTQLVQLSSNNAL